MSYKTIYVILYKETTNSNGIPETETGVCEWGYNNEEEAINHMWDITDGKMNEFSDEVDDDHCYRECNRNGDWQMVRVNDDTYEYWIENVGVPVDNY